MVVGAGIGGLCAALGLRRVGWDVVVLEQATTIAPVGAGITLFSNAQAGLDRLGVLDRLRAVGTAPPLANAGLRLPDGRWVARVGESPDLLALHRAVLHQVLLDALPPQVVRTGARITDPQDPRLDGDLVVVADGIGSVLRAALLPDAAGPAYAGYTSWRGVTSGPFTLPDGGGETWGAGRRFGLVPLADGRVYWFATDNQAAGRTFADEGTPSEHADVLRRFGHWHAPVREVVAATRPDDVLHHDISYLPPLPTFVHGRFALVGDAAHAMTPDLGQGACQAIEDAVELAAALSPTGPTARGHTLVAAALARYDASRRPRAQAIAASARRMGRFAQRGHPLTVGLRTALMRATPPSAATRMIERVTAWTPPSLPPSAPQVRE